MSKLVDSHNQDAFAKYEEDRRAFRGWRDGRNLKRLPAAGLILAALSLVGLWAIGSALVRLVMGV